MSNNAKTKNVALPPGQFRALKAQLAAALTRATGDGVVPTEAYMACGAAAADKLMAMCGIAERRARRRSGRAAAWWALALAACALVQAASAQRIAYPTTASPEPGGLHSYFGVVVTGAVAQASERVVLERTQDLRTWTPVCTNALVAGRGDFWLGRPAEMSWTVLYDYGWTSNRAGLYRVAADPRKRKSRK